MSGRSSAVAEVFVAQETGDAIAQPVGAAGLTLRGSVEGILELAGHADLGIAAGADVDMTPHLLGVGGRELAVEVLVESP